MKRGGIVQSVWRLMVVEVACLYPLHMKQPILKKERLYGHGSEGVGAEGARWRFFQERR